MAGAAVLIAVFAIVSAARPRGEPAWDTTAVEAQISADLGVVNPRCPGGITASDRLPLICEASAERPLRGTAWRGSPVPRDDDAMYTYQVVVMVLGDALVSSVNLDAVDRKGHRAVEGP